MKEHKNTKPVKKTPIPSRPVCESYEEPWRPLKPHTTSDKSEYITKEDKAPKTRRGKYG